MKQYNVYAHPNGRAEAVKTGWSYPAFFFGWMWALVKRMWKVGFILLALYAAFRLLYYWIDTPPTTHLKIAFIFTLPLLYIAMMGVLGMYGNKWLEDSLKARGFVFKAQVVAMNKKSAAGRWSGRP